MMQRSRRLPATAAPPAPTGRHRILRKKCTMAPETSAQASRCDDGEQDHREARRLRARLRRPAGAVDVAPGLFAIGLGFEGLSGAWRVASGPRHSFSGVASVIAVLSAVLLLAVVLPWIAQLVRRQDNLISQLRDPATGPAVPVAAFTAMLLSATLIPVSGTAGRTLVAIFAILTLVLCLAVVAGWVVGRLPLRDYNPSFYLATLGGAMLAAQSITALGWAGAARALFALGLAAWVILGVITGVRLVRGPKLPGPLQTTLVLELAAPALAANTYLVVFRQYDSVAIALALATLLMAAAQLALIPVYRRAWFNPGFWSFAFSYATACTLALRWTEHEQPAGAVVWQWLTLGLLTALVLALTLRSVIALRRGELLPRKPQQDRLRP
jgi:tellurite resistance protein